MAAPHNIWRPAHCICQLFWIHSLCMSKSDVLALTTLGTLLVLAGIASAERPLVIALSGTCPARDAVLAAIKDAATVATTFSSELEEAVPLIVRDDGLRYHVQIASTIRTFNDPLR